MIAAHQEVTDLEIVADLFRLARTGRFKSVKTLVREAQTMYPQETEDRIRGCVIKLGQKMHETDFQGFATDPKLALPSKSQ